MWLGNALTEALIEGTSLRLEGGGTVPSPVLAGGCAGREKQEVSHAQHPGLAAVFFLTSVSDGLAPCSAASSAPSAVKRALLLGCRHPDAWANVLPGAFVVVQEGAHFEGLGA